ncbi:MAG TPA: carbohydrate kinase family protein [Thermoleophilaceae bacterium]|nr:carbohydrate kinase family protein [Thermoleophilaceae bacterium]
MSRVVVLGDVMVDVVARLGSPIARGSDAPAQISLGGGGSAANVAAWLAAAGVSPTLVGRVGDDQRGREARAALIAAGVDAQLTTDPRLPTGTCIVIVEPEGERTMLPDAGANDALAAADLDGDLLAAAGHLHVAGYVLLREGSRPAALSAVALARDHGMAVSVDPSSAALLSPAFLGRASGADLLLPNAEEARALTGEDDPELAARRLSEVFAEVVVKLGEAGARWTDGRSVRRSPAEPVQGVTDTTGAGDAFDAGLIAARVHGAQPAEALAAACRLAARAVRTPGARPWAL